jgi:hypothetical protein
MYFAIIRIDLHVLAYKLCEIVAVSKKIIGFWNVTSYGYKITQQHVPEDHILQMYNIWTFIP